MKLFIAVLALVACVSADWTPKTVSEIMAVRAECIKENSLTTNYIAQIKNFVYPDEEPIRKYIMCSALKMGTFSTDAGYNAERVAKQFKVYMQESEVLAMAQDCIAKNPKTIGQSADVWAYKVHKCFFSSTVGEKIIANIKKDQERLDFVENLQI